MLDNPESTLTASVSEHGGPAVPFEKGFPLITEPVLHAPETDGQWLRPASTFPAEPRWGHPDGVQVGLHPLRGPRGLLRIFAPYLDHPRDRLINFIAVEPIPVGADGRGLSELEPSSLDPAPGKRFWSVDDAGDCAAHPDDEPARGGVETVDGVERLTVVIGVERFDNGAEVYLRLTFRQDRPHEFGVAAFRRPGSVELDRCILSATMGNFARLRRLELADAVVTPADLWPDYRDEHFTAHAEFPLSRLTRTADGDAVASATPDETDPVAATYGEDTNEHWKYVGLLGRQTWRAPDPDPDLAAQVNGRYAYWRSTSPIPGGIAYENFELSEPFRDGRDFYFSVTPMSAASGHSLEPGQSIAAVTSESNTADSQR